MIQIDEVEADKRYESSDNLRLSERVSSIRIKYHGMSFKTKQMRYNYMLEGYDADWKATWDEDIVYEQLPVGEYRFFESIWGYPPPCPGYYGRDENGDKRFI